MEGEGMTPGRRQRRRCTGGAATKERKQGKRSGHKRLMCGHVQPGGREATDLEHPGIVAGEELLPRSGVGL